MLDVLIIGSGPAGLSAAIYASRARLSAVVCERDSMGTGQISAAEKVDNYPGMYGILGYDLGEKFRSHALALGAEIVTGRVTKIESAENGFSALLDSGKTLSAQAVIYAAGTSYRRLGVPGDELPGVSYCATCDGAFYRQKTAAVIGGGDTALTDALYLSEIAAKVLLIHRRNEFRASAALVERARGIANIEFVTNARVVEIFGEKRVEGLELEKDGARQRIAADGVFAAIGSTPNTDILRGLTELDAHGYIIAAEDGRTSLKGLYAAGDVRAKALRQVVTAAADGASCVNSIVEDRAGGRD